MRKDAVAEDAATAPAPRTSAASQASRQARSRRRGVTLATVSSDLNTAAFPFRFTPGF